MKVTVLGCGPSGLLAVHAAVERGHEVRVIAPGSPSLIGGAQYIHVPIPGATREDEMEMITYTKVGSKQGYARKVYGAEDAPVSWDIFGIGDYPAWPMMEIYQRLWATYMDSEDHQEVTHVPASITPNQVHSIAMNSDIVLSSIPARAICAQADHMFKGQVVYTIDAPLIGVRNLIVYNGRDDDEWYRASNLFGHTSVEISEALFDTELAQFELPAFPGSTSWPVKRGVKPVHTNCDCHLHLPNFFRIGRFGQWRKGVLVSHAYQTANVAMDTIEKEVSNEV